MSDGDPEVAFRSLIRAISSMKVEDGHESVKMEELRKEAELAQKRALLEKYTQTMITLEKDGLKRPSSGIYVLPIDLSEASDAAFKFALESAMKPGDQLVLGHFIVDQEDLDIKGLGAEIEAKIRAKFLSKVDIKPEPLLELMVLDPKEFNRAGIARAIARWAEKHGAAMIIMATHETGLKVKLTGSVTSHLQKMTNIPVSNVNNFDTPKLTKKTSSFWKRNAQTASEE